MQEILNRQDETSMLRLQFASRHYYNAAEILNRCLWWFSLLSAGTILLPGSIPEWLRLGIPIAADLLCVFLTCSYHKVVSLAAKMREYFDAYVLNLNLEDIDRPKRQELNEKALKIVERHQSDANIQMANTGTDDPPGVKRWYDLDTEMSEEDAVYECQRQNGWWNSHLAKMRGKKDLINICLFLLAIYLYASYQKKTFRLGICLLSIFIKVIDCIVANIEYYLLSVKIDAVIENLSRARSADNIIELQKLINKRRAIPVLERNSIHKSNARKLSELYKTTNG